MISRLRLRSCPALLALLLAGCVTVLAGCASGPSERREQIARALTAANADVAPAIGRQVAFDTSTNAVRVVFTTPFDFRIDYNNFWWRWRRNQAVALRPFDQLEIAVDTVIVETNHTDGSGRVRVTSPADVIRAFGTEVGEAGWRAGSVIEQQETGKSEWTPIEGR